MKSSIYQSELWKQAKSLDPSEVISTPNFLAFVVKKKFPFIKSKKIIFSRGNPSSIEELMEFKKLSKKYFYGLIMPPSINPTHELFEKSGFKKVSNHTIIIDLSKSEEDLWKNLEKKSNRWGAKYAEKNGLTFKLAKKSEIHKFFEMYKKIARDGNFEFEDIKFLKILADTGVSSLFLIKRKSQILGGGLILFDKINNHAILDLTAVSDEGLKFQAMPFLYWNLIKHAKNKGFKYFDLGGYDSEAKEGDKTYNINKFKERFGGQIIEQPIYSTNWKYPFLRKIFRLFKKIKK